MGGCIHSHTQKKWEGSPLPQHKPQTKHQNAKFCGTTQKKDNSSKGLHIKGEDCHQGLLKRLHVPAIALFIIGTMLKYSASVDLKTLLWMSLYSKFNFFIIKGWFSISSDSRSHQNWVSKIHLSCKTYCKFSYSSWLPQRLILLHNRIRRLEHCCFRWTEMLFSGSFQLAEGILCSGCINDGVVSHMEISDTACYPALFPRMELDPWWGRVHHFLLLPGMSWSGLPNGALGAGPPLCTATGNELVKFLGSPHPALCSLAWNELIRSANWTGSGWSSPNMDVEEPAPPSCFTVITGDEVGIWVCFAWDCSSHSPLR